MGEDGRGVGSGEVYFKRAFTNIFEINIKTTTRYQL